MKVPRSFGSENNQMLTSLPGSNPPVVISIIPSCSISNFGFESSYSQFSVQEKLNSIIKLSAIKVPLLLFSIFSSVVIDSLSI